MTTTTSRETITVPNSEEVVVRYVTEGDLVQLLDDKTEVLLGTIERRPDARPSFRWAAKTANGAYSYIHRTRRAAAENILHNVIRLCEPGYETLAK